MRRETVKFGLMERERERERARQGVKEMKGKKRESSSNERFGKEAEEEEAKNRSDLEN